MRWLWASFVLRWSSGRSLVNVPKMVEPDLKNLKTMIEAWTLLDQEYGQVKELINELIKGLMKFSVPRGEYLSPAVCLATEEVDPGGGRYERS